MVEKKFRILICPLEWGIGHATRCVPVIRQLVKNNHQVIIAADDRPFDFLKEVFPELEFVRLKGFKVFYPEGKNMVMKMVLQSPTILSGIYREHQRLKKIIREYGIDAVISDNRFGMWSKKVHSVYITHQLMIKAPERMKWAEPILHRVHQWIIRHYDECWVPDIPGEKNLSGDLGHQYALPSNAHFIGILSRVNTENSNEGQDVREKGPELLFLLSGPEPQRSILEEIILNQLKANLQSNVVILRGIPGSLERTSPLPGVISHNHLPDEEIARLIRTAGTIICRPGYSTLMDLVTLGRNAVLVPTPGQTEQEYLAVHLSKKGMFIMLEQDGFSLEVAINKARELPKFTNFRNDDSLMENAINVMLTKLILGKSG